MESGNLWFKNHYWKYHEKYAGGCIATVMGDGGRGGGVVTRKICENGPAVSDVAICGWWDPKPPYIRMAPISFGSSNKAF